MADNKETVVEVADDDVVTVDVSGLDLPPAAEGEDEATPSLAELKEAAGKQQTTTQTRKAPAQEQQTTPADEAAAALTKAMETAESNRKRAEAAEQTAAAERQRAEEANRRVASVSQEAEQFRDQAFQGQLNSIQAAIEAANTDLASAKQEYARAFEAGEAMKMADAQERISRAASKIEANTNKKSEIEAAVARSASDTTRQQQTTQQQDQRSPFERYVAQFPPRAQAWLRSHPDHVPAAVGGNATKNATMMEGHYAALRQGATEGSDDYFRILDEHVSPPASAVTSAAAKTTPAASDAGKQQQETQPAKRQQRQPTPAAPVSRDAPDASGTPQSTRSVKLNAQQQEVALFSYPQKKGEEEAAWRKRAFGTYAQEYLKAQAEGKIGRLTH